jgi:ATP-dependent RNA helicase DDX56/DBP9
MKRKLDANDVPSPEPAGADEKEFDFEALNLDPRLRQALIKENFSKPTLIQAKAIPLALEGKDILGESTPIVPVFLYILTKTARAKTGSGKTAAYVLPILQAILQRKSVSLIICSESKDERLLMLSCKNRPIPR